MTKRALFDPDAERGQSKAQWMRIAVHLAGVDRGNAEMLYDLAFFHGWDIGSIELIRTARRDGLDFASSNFKMERDAILTVREADWRSNRSTC
jgi:hypothetical protein